MKYAYYNCKEKVWVKFPSGQGQWVPLKIFECHAFDILISDKFFEEATGINSTKAPYIGCECIGVEAEKVEIVSFFLLTFLVGNSMLWSIIKWYIGGKK